MKLHIELNSEEEFIQFASYMQQEKHNLAEVLFNRYKEKYESTAAQLKKLQEKIEGSQDDKAKYYAIEINDPLSDFFFSARAYNCLRAEQISTVGHLLEYSESDLMKIPNMGKRSLENIKEVLAHNGLQLKSEEKNERV